MVFDFWVKLDTECLAAYYYEFQDTKLKGGSARTTWVQSMGELLCVTPAS